jgi:hypothetical protein
MGEDMKNNLLVLWFCVAALFAGGVLAGPGLSIRLVEASNAGQGAGGGLEDVAQLLKENLPFNSFRLLASRSMALPANGSVTLDEGIQARCSGDQRNLTVVIERGRKEEVRSTVELRRDTPLIVGGFPSKNGKMIVILMLKE